MATSLLEVRVPDIGDFEDVDVIEVLVAVGDRVAANQSLVTLESEKATMELPTPAAGVVRELAVAVGSRVSEGSLIARIEAEAAEQPVAPARAEQRADAARAPAAARGSAEPGAASGPADLECDVLVLGAGPGGYTAAFRAADLGQRVVLVERYAVLGGVCLNVGCIPSKALLHVAEVMTEVRALEAHGVRYGEPAVDLAKLRAHKDSVVKRLTDGLAGLAQRRKVERVTGVARFESPNRALVEVAGEGRAHRVAFAKAIIAVGSHSIALPGLPQDRRILDSTSALALADVPASLLIVGGGIIGLEMAAVYRALGSRISVVELTDQLMPGVDPDLVRIFRKIVDPRCENVWLETKLAGIEAKPDGLEVRLEGKSAPATERFDRVLVAVGRRANGDRIDAAKAGVEVEANGQIAVNHEQRTNVPHVFAIGDVTKGPMLAHKAMHEAKVAAEVAAGHKSAFVARAIPSVAYTDPEVAWMGLTEVQAKREGREVRVARFPWSASGRALGLGRDEGLTKLLFDSASGRLLGAGIVGPHAGDLIAEAVLALEMDAEAGDLALSIHPHPTLSETLSLAAEVAEGTVTDLYLPKRR
jgi:dihydrolipoamide dehydrogenase